MQVTAPRVRWVREKGQLYEHRSRVTDIVECPRCGNDVECEGETEEWHLKRSRWHHTLYGPGRGECCGFVIVVGFDGCHVLDLGAAQAEARAVTQGDK